MKKLGDLIKGKSILHVDGKQSVSEVIRYMTDNNIGAVLVICDGKVDGIFSERDVMRRVMLPKLDPDKTKVEDVMTKELIVMQSTDSYEHCMSVMKIKNIRHIPVRENDRMIGMISMRDLMEMSVDDKAEEIDFLRQYIYFSP
jgi:CBS domain-containing protein